MATVPCVRRLVLSLVGRAAGSVWRGSLAAAAPVTRYHRRPRSETGVLKWERERETRQRVFEEAKSVVIEEDASLPPAKAVA